MAQTAQPLHQHRDEYGYPTQPDSRRKLRDLSVHTSKRILLTAIYGFMSVIGCFLWLGRLAQKQPQLTPQTFYPRRILVIRLDLIGDLVLSLPVVRLLKRAYPEAEIDLLAIPSSAKVVAADPDLAEIIAYDPNIWRRPKALFRLQNWREANTLLRNLHTRQYDLAVSVFGPWAAIMALASGAKRRLGFGREGYPGFMTDKVPGRHWDPRDHLHEVDYCLRLAQAAGATIRAGDRFPRLYVDPQARQEADALLLEAGLQPAKPLIACHVSSNNGQSKRWPIPYWATLIDRLIKDTGVNVVLTGAPNDLPLIADLTQRLHTQPINLAGKTTLAQLAAALRSADLLISGDSGPMHIAGAVGTPVIAIHGPTDPALSGPVSSNATILRSDIWCSPCYATKGPADCRFYTTQCMKDITPNRVFSAARDILQKNALLPANQEVDE
ncbi:MAG TPA: lipopolysaccharide heptosyltransferase II [Ktedonosporobacter sp.]|jgi:lipopolysaccharide heptosyltransferase II|nr:lipopolysaccharide heptosyltransferase II [Ktedonosporobacter sp.]